MLDYVRFVKCNKWKYSSLTFVVLLGGVRCYGGNPICRSGFVPLDWENQIGISDLSSGAAQIRDFQNISIPDKNIF